MRFENIVIGVDFSAESLAAVRWVSDSFAPEARLILVHAVPQPAPPRVPGRRFASGEVLVEAARQGADERLEEIVASLPPGRATWQARCGEPSEILARAAQEGGADLVVVGPHSRRPGFRGMLGSTGEGLMLSAPTPVLLVGEPADGPPRSILSPVDGSPLSGQVLKAAYEVASAFGSRLIALHVHDTATYAALSVLHARDGDRIRSEAWFGSRLWLDQYLDLSHVPRSEVSLTISFGEVRHEILAMAQQMGAELIVMGSHGRGRAFMRRAIGSVAAWVLRHSRRSVLVLHGTGTEQPGVVSVSKGSAAREHQGAGAIACPGTPTAASPYL